MTALALIVIVLVVLVLVLVVVVSKHNKGDTVMFKPRAIAEVQDWITPLQVEVVKVATHADQFERIKQKARELREEMGPRYLCNEKNRVRRLDGRVYIPREIGGVNVRALKRKEAA